jgi:hypothetical protein
MRTFSFVVGAVLVEGDAGQRPELCHFLNAYHVIETVNPNQMDEVGFQTNGSFQFHGRKQKRTEYSRAAPRWHRSHPQQGEKLYGREYSGKALVMLLRR